MPRFCVLASGSSGNAAFVEADGFGLLIDIGLGPRLLASRLAVIGRSWKNVHSVVLTHVHTDHWKDRTIAQLRTQKIPLYCHPGHHETLSYNSPSFGPLRSAGLVRDFESGRDFVFPNGWHCLPIPVPHDSDPTFAFRIDGSPDLFGHSWSLGYAADLGMTPQQLLDTFEEVNLLALEFNHDEELEKTSGRSPHLIDRVLSDMGHLSNWQAAQSFRQIASNSAGNLRHLIQLHLSRDCNRPAFAHAAAKEVTDELGHSISIQTARQDRPTRVIELVSDLCR